MIELNRHYAELEDSYLFAGIAQKVAAYAEAHPGERILRLGIGDVSLPLPEAVIAALHEAVDEQANPETFQGYLPECGAPFLRKAIVDHYATRGVFLDAGEVFVSSGASDELGDILDLFDSSSPALVIEPAYPAYVDASVIAGRRIVRLESGKDDGFAPWPDPALEADLIYLCSPSNPTGAHFTRDKLKAISPTRAVPSSCSTPLTRRSSRTRTSHIASSRWKARAPARSRSARFPRRRASRARAWATPSSPSTLSAPA